MIRAAGIMFLTPEGETLLLKRGPGSDWPGAFCFPGGKLEEGEETEDAAKRECVEEVGFLPPGQRMILTRRIADGVDYTTFVQKIDEKFIPEVDGEHVAFMWVRPSVALGELPVPQERTDRVQRADSVEGLLARVRERLLEKGIDATVSSEADPQAALSALTCVEATAEDLRTRFPGIVGLGAQTRLELLHGDRVDGAAGEEMAGSHDRTSVIRLPVSLEQDDEPPVAGQWHVSMRRSLPKTYRHETGHKLMDLIEEAARARPELVDLGDWSLRKLYLESKRSYDVARTLSQYAAQDRDEWFAESFSVFTHPRRDQSSCELCPVLCRILSAVLAGDGKDGTVE